MIAGAVLVAVVVTTTIVSACAAWHSCPWIPASTRRA